MNKKEKALSDKLLGMYNGSVKSESTLTREDLLIIERWLVIGILNRDAFTDVTSHDANHRQYIYTKEYPFTSLGNDEIKKSWYFHFRDSNGIKIVRDIFTVIAFFTSLVAVILSLLK